MERTDAWQLAKDLAVYLPGYKAPAELPESLSCVELTHESGDGRGIFINYRDRNKLTISLLFPHGYAPDIRPSIGVTISRGVEKIAKEIERRLLPGYDTEFQAQQDRKQSYDNFVDKKRAIRNKIVEMLEDTIHPNQENSDEVTVYRYGVDRIRVCSESVEFHVDLPTDTAYEFVEWLKERLPKSKYAAN